MIPTSSIYTGLVAHFRTRPKAHRLRYRVFTLLLDLDALQDLDRDSPLFAFNRAGVFSFHDGDHGAGTKGGLKDWVKRELRACGLRDEGPIFVMCYPRIFGYVFNPLTLYFCYRPDGGLRAILYEVANTFGERHTYVIPAGGSPGNRVRQSCQKRFYVSPFLDQDGRYEFRIHPPGDDVSVAIQYRDRDGPLLFAMFKGSRRPLTTRALFGVMMSYPLMTFKVVAAIHFEALRLWWKGVPVFRHRARTSKVTTSTDLSFKDHKARIPT